MVVPVFVVVKIVVVSVGLVDVVMHSEQPEQTSVSHFSDQEFPNGVPSQSCSHAFVDVDVDVLVDVGVGHAWHITGHHVGKVLIVVQAWGFRGVTPQSFKSAAPP